MLPRGTYFGGHVWPWAIDKGSFSYIRTLIRNVGSVWKIFPLSAKGKVIFFLSARKQIFRLFSCLGRKRYVDPKGERQSLKESKRYLGCPLSGFSLDRWTVTTQIRRICDMSQWWMAFSGVSWVVHKNQGIFSSRWTHLTTVLNRGNSWNFTW